jgi:hypothetical protein
LFAYFYSNKLFLFALYFFEGVSEQDAEENIWNKEGKATGS